MQRLSRGVVYRFCFSFAFGDFTSGCAQSARPCASVGAGCPHSAMHPSVNPAYPGCHNQRSIKAPLFKTVRVAKPRTSPLQAERFSAESRHRSLRTIAGSSDKDVSAKRQPELRMLSGARGLRVLEFITRLGAGQVEIPQIGSCLADLHVPAGSSKDASPTLVLR